MITSVAGVMADAFPISGNIDPRSFPFLLTDLHRNGATGSLKVEGPTYQKALYFRSGRILFGSSNDPRDQLGAILIENAKITHEQLDDVNLKVGPGRPLAKVLSESGLVNQQELSEAAQIKVERILWDIVTYQSGTFEFEDGVLPKGAVDLKLSTERLILASIRRVSDPAFVARHLGDANVVLHPTAELTSRLHEVQSDAGGLAEQIDGQRTLKEAAAAARLDEFEASKVACGLLILGFVEKPGDAPAFVDPIPEEDDSIDLAATARSSLEGDSAETPFFIPDGMEAPHPSPPASPAPLAFEPEVEADPEFLADTIAVPPPDAAPEPAPPPYEPAFFAPPAASTNTPPPGLPLIPPPPRTARPPVDSRPIPPTEVMSLPSEIIEPTPPPTPPSKADLAALDALLNPHRSQNVSSRDQLGRDAGHWEPRFSGLSGGARRAGRQGSSMKLVVGLAVLIILGGGGGAAWLYLNRQSRPRVASDRTVPTPAEITRPKPPVTAAPATAAPATAAPTVETAAPVSTATAQPTRQETEPPAVVASPSPPSTHTPRNVEAAAAGDRLGEARALMKGGRYREAANMFAGHIQTSASSHFTVQLLVACSDETVHKATDNVAQGELFITPIDYKGRSCYRMGWGLYENEARATQALRSLPDYFHQPGVSPRVVPAAALLH